MENIKRLPDEYLFKKGQRVVLIDKSYCCSATKDIPLLTFGEVLETNTHPFVKWDGIYVKTVVDYKDVILEEDYNGTRRTKTLVIW